jgi:anti-anti-sigma regulatory factor
VLDLSQLTDVDHTGTAVLVAAGRDLKTTGSQVRVVTADRSILGRLPYTLGLRRTFGSLAEALSFRG